MPGLLFAVLLALVSTWTETWSNGTPSWVDGSGQPFVCSTTGGVLHATRGCDQQAFSIRRWDQTQPVTVSGTVRGQPVGSTPYFCGLALIEASDHRVYGQAAVGRNIEPVSPLDGQTHTVAWNGEYPYPGSRYFYGKGVVDPNTWQAFSVAWNPSRQTWSLTFAGKTHSNRDSGVTSPLAVDLQGAPLYDDGSECQFGQLTVQGVQL